MTALVEIAVLLWYRREDWPALHELFVDADLLHSTWDEWQREAAKGELSLQQSGKLVIRAEIRPEPFAAWCANLGIAANAMARKRWASGPAYRETRQQN